ncbi:MAG: NifU family protein [Nitrospinota bacterium]|nr:NifU family protein [Nitrospinota bacterium]
MKVIKIEETPNPAALKFIMDGPVVTSGSQSFAVDEDEEYHGDNPLAKGMFQFGAVSVFLCQNYVSVTMFKDNIWEHFLADIKNVIETKLLPPGEKPPEKEKKPSVLDTLDKEKFPSLSNSEKSKIIDQLFDEMVRPALMSDGGNMEIIKVEENEVTIKYQGACGSCPSSTGGTLFAIERALKGYLDPNLKVSIASS